MNKNNGHEFADYVQSLKVCRSRMKELERNRSELESLEPLIDKADDLMKRYKGLGKEATELISQRDYQKAKAMLAGLPNAVRDLEAVLNDVRQANAVEPEHVSRRSQLLTFCAEGMRSAYITKAAGQGRQLLQEIAAAAAEAERVRLEEIARRKREEEQRRKEEEQRLREAEMRRLQREQEEKRERERVQREKRERIQAVQSCKEEVKENGLSLLAVLLQGVVSLVLGGGCFVLDGIFFHILGVCFFIYCVLMVIMIIYALPSLFDSLRDLRSAKLRVKYNQ